MINRAKKIKLEEQMKKAVATTILAIVLLGFTSSSFASDWDTAGKILTGIEGLRIITGGKVDLIGSMTGINNNNSYYRGSPNHYSYTYDSCNRNCQKVWVPDYTYKREYIPRHKVYDSSLGRYITVDGQYVEVKKERGGHWVYTCTSGGHYNYNNRSRRHWRH